MQLSLKLAKLINLMLLDGSNQVRYVRSNVGPQVSSMHLLPDLTYSIESHQNAAVQSHNFYKTEQKIISKS